MGTKKPKSMMIINEDFSTSSDAKVLWQVMRTFFFHYFNHKEYDQIIGMFLTLFEYPTYRQFLKNCKPGPLNDEERKKFNTLFQKEN